MGEHMLRKHGVVGSIPITSTNNYIKLVIIEILC